MHSLVRCSVLPVVDVEADGAGDGEGQVGDDGEHVHPGGPVDILKLKSVLKSNWVQFKCMGPLARQGYTIWGDGGGPTPLSTLFPAHQDLSLKHK